ncbi:MAG TPA: hypothetical protein VGA99_10765 [bacterium]
MNDNLDVGLCKDCTYSRMTGNKRGSIFVFCEYSKVDSEFAKYPRLPVLTCKAYQKVNGRKLRQIGGNHHED